jgi:hypothetical protein
VNAHTAEDNAEHAEHVKDILETFCDQAVDSLLETLWNNVELVRKCEIQGRSQTLKYGSECLTWTETVGKGSASDPVVGTSLELTSKEFKRLSSPLEEPEKAFKRLSSPLEEPKKAFKRLSPSHDDFNNSTPIVPASMKTRTHTQPRRGPQRPHTALVALWGELAAEWEEVSLPSQL